MCDAYETFKTERILNEDSKRVLKEARKKAEDLKAEIIIYDLATFKSKLIARLRCEVSKLENRGIDIFIEHEYQAR